MTQKVRTRKTCTPDARFHKPFAILQCTCTIEHKLGENLPCARKGRSTKIHSLELRLSPVSLVSILWSRCKVRVSKRNNGVPATNHSHNYTVFSVFPRYVCLSSFSPLSPLPLAQDDSEQIKDRSTLTGHPFNPPHSDLAFSFRSWDADDQPWPRQPDTSTTVYSSQSIFLVTPSRIY